MASLRRVFWQELVERLAAIDGCEASLRDREAPESTAPWVAVVTPLGESKQPRDTLFYECTLRLGVLCLAHAEDADATEDDGNPYLYLDRLVIEIEKAVHASPWPHEAIASLEGHQVKPLDNTNQLQAMVNVVVQYRHNFQDPSTYDPTLNDL